MNNSNRLEFTLITGLSGAGKSQAIHCFEDLGYFCIDNLPPALLDDMAKLGLMPGSKVKKIAIVADVRGGEFFVELAQAVDQLKAAQVPIQILFLEASDETLIKRFKETRRRHPLAAGGDIVSDIQRERELLGHLRGRADLVVDTTGLSTGELRETILKSFLREKEGSNMLVTVQSFGFKYGIPRDPDIVMDVRFLPNPHYIPELKHHTGIEAPVRDYVLENERTIEFIAKFKELIDVLLPGYVKEGKTHLTIAIGCTGGNHRSVAIAVEIARHVGEAGYQSTLRHRDMGKDMQDSS